MKTTTRISVALAVTTVAVSAYATNKYILGSVTIAQVSGVKQIFIDTVEPGGSYHGLYGLTLEEDGDYACKMTAKTRHINTASEKVTEDQLTRYCSNPGSPKTVAFTLQDRYIRGVAVCLNAAENNIKGIRIYGADLDKSTGDLDPKGEKEFSRTNCKHWKTAKYCGVNKIAVGVDVHHSTTKYSGIALRCKKVDPK